MPTHPTTAPPSDTPSPVCIGIGIDTARYGHYAAFLRHDQQPAAAELAFAEAADGYARLTGRLEQLARRHPAVACVEPLDVAGL
jgi:hypothetical protein